MRSFLSFVVNNLTSKAKGPSPSNTTASEQPSLEEMDVTQDPLPIASHRLKRQASSSSSIEFPRKKRMENPIHPEAGITSQTENIGRTVRFPQNSKTDKFHQDAAMAFSASHELALSKKEYLGYEPPGDALPDSSPCSSPVPSLAFDILSSDCDYDDAPLGDILLLDLDNDDSPEVRTTLPMNISTGSSEGSNDSNSDVPSWKQELDAACNAFTVACNGPSVVSEFDEQELRTSDAALCIPTRDSNLSLIRVSELSSRNLVSDVSPSSPEFPLSNLPITSTLDPFSTTPDYMTSERVSTKTATSVADATVLVALVEPSINHMLPLRTSRSEAYINRTSIRPKHLSRSRSTAGRLQTTSRPLLATKDPNDRKSHGSPPSFASAARCLTDTPHPQDIPPPIRPPGTTPSRPSSPQPQRPRPARPGSDRLGSTSSSPVTNASANTAVNQLGEAYLVSGETTILAPGPTSAFTLPSRVCHNIQNDEMFRDYPLSPSRLMVSTSATSGNSALNSDVDELSDEMICEILRDIHELLRADTTGCADNHKCSQSSNVVIESNSKPARMYIVASDGETSDEEPLALCSIKRLATGSTPSVTASNDFIASSPNATCYGKKNSVSVSWRGDPLKTGKADKSQCKPEDASLLSCATLKDRCQLLWKGAPSLFPFPSPYRPRTKVTQALEKAIRKAVSFSAAINEVEQQQLPISKPDEHALRRSMLHPPRPHRYDLDNLIAFQGICWDISAFVAMELSAIPWLAFVESDGRAQGHCLDESPARNTGPRGRKWSRCEIEIPEEAFRDADLFVHLYSGIALPDWFISGGGVEMDELETECAGEDGGSRTDAGSPSKNVHMIC